MRYFHNIVIMCLLLFFAGCVDFYKAEGTEQMRGVLVVEGIIGDETRILLSTTVGLHEQIYPKKVVNNAVVTVEKEDGTVYATDEEIEDGIYNIPVPDLSMESGYRLRIKWGMNEYLSEFLTPMNTPDIKEIKFDKHPTNKQVSVYVSTGEVDQTSSPYFTWSWDEIWEIESEMYALAGLGEFRRIIRYNEEEGPRNPIWHCWLHNYSQSFVFETYHPNMGGNISDRRLFRFDCRSSRLEYLYYLKVRQNLVRKEYYEYASTLIKNAEMDQEIFGPIPSEMEGNIKCISNPDVPVIGYVDVSRSAIVEMFMDAGNPYYESPTIECNKYFRGDYILEKEAEPDRLIGYDADGWPIVWTDTRPRWESIEKSVTMMDTVFRDTGNYGPIVDTILFSNPCINCLYRSGTKKKPKWWPNDHV